MSLYSINFLLFFSVVFIIYYALPKQYRYIGLLTASYFFYISYSPRYAIILIILTLITYLGAFGIEKGYRKICFSITIIASLGILLFFKYWLFALVNINRVLNVFHIQELSTSYDILLPIGISFYTLQSLGYLIDVYKEKISSERNFAKYALYVSFFPTILSGPIERSNNLLKQIQEGTDFSYEGVKKGFLLIILGYFEKILIANKLAQMVDYAFLTYTNLSGAAILFAMILYALQIYMDFAGYSFLALGISKSLGIHLVENFRQPYFALNIKDFWRRWHISLSRWLRDYIYIPLGGSHCSTIRTYSNLLITFLISGLWHGAGWCYILWGGLHGFYQILSPLTAGIRTKFIRLCKINVNSFGYKMIQRIITFCMVDFAWLFFRSPNISTAVYMIKQAITNFCLVETIRTKTWQLGMDGIRILILFSEILLIFIIDILREKNINIIAWINGQNTALRWVCYYMILLLLLIGAIYNYGAGTSTFIYSAF